MKVAIVKYNAGNIRSVTNALDRLGVESVLTDEPEILKSADKVIFPGVGEASSAMNYLNEKHLTESIKSLTQPLLAICLGMQLLCQSSEENDTECLGILPHRVKRFTGTDVRIPQIGWNTLSSFRSPLFDGVDGDSHVYFANSYFVELGENTIATAFHGNEFSAALAYKNFYGVQFHPEKSGLVGARILENFIKI